MAVARPGRDRERPGRTHVKVVIRKTEQPTD